MIIYLLVLFIVVIVTPITMIDNYDTSIKTWILHTRWVLAGTFMMGMIAHIITVCVSYDTYVNARAKYDAIITQYRQAVTMYADRAVIDINRATFTDFAYQGYQENVGNMIIDLRNQVTSYNRTMISKRTYKKNIFFRALIVAPDDDMKIINLIEETKGEKKDDTAVKRTGTVEEDKKPGV